MIITRRADIIRHINIITLDGVVMTEHRYRLREPWLFARKFHIESLHTLRVHDGTCIGIVYTVTHALCTCLRELNVVFVRINPIKSIVYCYYIGLGQYRILHLFF